MERLRRMFKFQDEQSYERLAASETLVPGDEVDNHTARVESNHDSSFSYVEYYIFMLQGVSMLWAWNMFLAAGPYFQHRFRGSQWLLDNFQAAEISVSTVTNFGSMLILTRLQASANYPKRIIASLIINMAVFALLAASTAIGISAGAYFGFLMLMIFLTSLAAGLCQNGIFAYVSGFAQPTYTQSLMTGQAVAGVLPCIAQIVSVLSVTTPSNDHSPDDPELPGPPAVPWTSALAYFSTATIISVITLLAFFYLLARNRHSWRDDGGGAKVQDDRDRPRSNDDDDRPERKRASMVYLFRKLPWLASGVFVTFAVTMVYPVFTQQILSNRPLAERGRLFQPPTFIPLAFLFWNTGDLIGRMITAVPSLSLVSRPRVVFGLAVCRVVFVGFYHLCNLRGAGAVVPSDFFYLIVVQLFFGMTNGYLGSTCMIGAAEWVEPDEREAAGGFMGLCLVAGLTVGSLASFFVAGI